jgi:hypothetical protein
MPKQSVEIELLSLEKRYWTALREKDADAALELTNDPLLHHRGPGGKPGGPQDLHQDDGERARDAQPF